MRNTAATVRLSDRSDGVTTDCSAIPVTAATIDCDFSAPCSEGRDPSAPPIWSPFGADAALPIYVAGDAIALPLQGLSAIAADLKTFAMHHDPALAAILLINVSRPAVDEFMILKDIVERQSAVVPIVIVDTCETNLAVELMKAGATDVLESPVDARQLLRALAAAVERTQQRDDVGAATRLARARIDSLSPRERSVFNGLIGGWPNKIIASRLALSPRTVEIHRAKMMTKLKLRTVAQVLQLAFTAGVTFEDTE